MTMRIYSTTSELTGSDPTKRKGARFKLILGHRERAYGKPILKTLEFMVCGTTDAAVEACAIDIAEQILTLTDSKIMGFHKILGHWRQDEELPVVPRGTAQAATVGFSPDPSDNLEAVNLSFTIPNFIGTVADANALPGTGTHAGGTAGLGYIRWEDQTETELEAMYASLTRGTNFYGMSKVYNEALTEDNVSDGVADGVLGPKV